MTPSSFFARAHAYVDRLWADAGITEGMSEQETHARLTAEHTRRDKLAKEQEAQAAFWRAVQRRRAAEEER